MHQLLLLRWTPLESSDLMLDQVEIGVVLDLLKHPLKLSDTGPLHSGLLEASQTKVVAILKRPELTQEAALGL